jgi:uncharacterized protein
MRIYNKTKERLVASNALVARGLPQRMRGLIGRTHLPVGHGLVISPCSAIHTVMMRFTIDAIFFDSKMRAVAGVHGLKPNRFSKWYPRARGVIELPAGTLSESPVEPGDELCFLDT